MKVDGSHQKFRKEKLLIGLQKKFKRMSITDYNTGSSIFNPRSTQNQWQELLLVTDTYFDNLSRSFSLPDYALHWRERFLSGCQNVSHKQQFFWKNTEMYWEDKLAGSLALIK